MVVHKGLCHDTPLFHLSCCRMTTSPVRVWVKLQDGKRRSISVKVPSDAIVDDVIDAALDKMTPKRDPSLVVPKLEGEELDSDYPASSCATRTSPEQPIMLTVNRTCKAGTYTQSCA